MCGYLLLCVHVNGGALDCDLHLQRKVADLRSRLSRQPSGRAHLIRTVLRF
jgi:hypothetical protein